VDGISDDGTLAIVVIALFGNPFSPAYGRRRGREIHLSHHERRANPLAHCSMNVALYARTMTSSAWSLAERSLLDFDRSADGVRMGASTMQWDGDRLRIDIDQRTTPLRRPLRGTVVLHPEAQTGLELTIDERGEHRWWPIAPLARIDVDFPRRGFRFSGHGYHDANAGDVPLEATFRTWSWSRARAKNGAYLTYDVTCASGADRSHAFHVSSSGALREIDATWTMPLPSTLFGLDRSARVDVRTSPKVVRSLEDGPFYARALVETELGGERVIAMHETLAAHRLRHEWVRAMTRFRM